MYKISIVIPVYNVENTIKSAFKSIYNQSIGFKNLEVIFVDDYSTDNSRDILTKLSVEYSNVKFIPMDENSGFAGKPRNIGIENATASYLMFLDPDDEYTSDACEVLYDTIQKYDSDFVSGNYVKYENGKYVPMNWNFLELDDNDIIQVNTIDENTDLFKTNPSVWAKIFKKEFVLDNKIKFPEYLPAQDLVFVGECLLKSSNTVFINKPVLKYQTSSNVDNKNKHVSVTSKKSKKNLKGFIKSYNLFYNLLNEYNPEYNWYAARHLFFWTRQLVTSNLGPEDKVELLKDANQLYEVFAESDNLNPPKDLKKFFDLVAKHEYINALAISDYLAIAMNDVDINPLIKKSKFFMLFFGFDCDIGGLAKAVFNRANMFDHAGYDVTLLNVDPNLFKSNLARNFKNISFIEKHHRELGYLNDNVEIRNMYHYYRDINTMDVDSNYKSNYFVDFDGEIYVSDDFVIKKTVKDDDSVLYDYYLKDSFDINDLFTLRDNKDNDFKLSDLDTSSIVLARSELYINDSLFIETILSHTVLIESNFYTVDGFNYLKLKYNKNNYSIQLNDRITSTVTDFEDYKEFVTYFVVEQCKSQEVKPFLINDCSGVVPSIENVDSSIAYKIGFLHSNPYKNPSSSDNELRDIALFNNKEDLDVLISLTESLNNDLKNQFHMDNIYNISNVIDMDDYIQDRDYDSIDVNKISIFARVSTEKNLIDALKAMKIVHESNPNVYLDIFGRALKPNEIKEYDKLQEYIKENDLEDIINFRGHVNNVNEEMASSLVTILVSHFEGLPMVILESMANGVPVISYDINYGPSDVIINNENGRLVEQYNVEQLAESILFFINNPEKSMEYGVNARKTIREKCSEEAVMNRWNDIIKKAYMHNNIKYFNHNYVNEIVYNVSRIVSKKNLRNEYSTMHNKLINTNTLRTTDKLKDDDTTIEYYKLKGSFKKKVLLWIPYVYILLKSGGLSNIVLNIRLYRALQNNSWFNIGYYLNNNRDLTRRKWCKLLTPETHYVCNGIDESRKPNPTYKGKSRKDVLSKLNN